jgi:hypothetical protein
MAIKKEKKKGLVARAFTERHAPRWRQQLGLAHV